MRHSHLLTAALIAAQAACTRTVPRAESTASRGLSAIERDAVREASVLDLVATNVISIPEGLARFVVSGGDGILALRVPAAELAAVEGALLAANEGAVMALDAPVDLRRDRRDDPSTSADEQLLFGGKEEFGLSAWVLAHPEADGRGVRIAVVDDGVALGRPGLLTTTDGRPKIASSINASSRWQLPLRAAPLSCERPVATAAASAAWNLDAVPELAVRDGAFRLAFDLDACGVNPGVTHATDKCFTWGEALAVPLAAQVAEVTGADGARRTFILVDADRDGAIAPAEVFVPLTGATVADQTQLALGDGRFVGFDLLNTALLGTAPADEPLASCAATAATERFLSVAVPESAAETGTHGEGVASIAAGHDIAGRGFDGVAPGAAVVDVHLGDYYAPNRYTIAELARVLRAGGSAADIVNLSYSLFFSSASAQVAMGRVLTSALDSTGALYFFSAGNNGPGRGSMNRALLYPSFAIPVGAYLTAEMAQSTFGSALGYGGVVSYSSRGPGLDGASGPLVMSPLAGIVASTSDGGFGPFSGTSSATPAMSGFAARVLSQVRAEGLTYSRDLFRQAILDSARPLEGVPFVDQGYGVAQLEGALVAYRALIGATLHRPALFVGGEMNAQGVTRRGVYVRGNAGRAPRYVFTLFPSFDTSWSEAAQGSYNEHLRIEIRDPATNAAPDWISAPSHLFVARVGSRLDVALDWAKIEALGVSEALAELRIFNADTNVLRQVIPVTIGNALPASNVALTGELTVVPATIERVYLERPEWATHLLVSSEVAGDGELCGGFTAYDPNGRRAEAVGTVPAAGGTRNLFVRDGAYAADKNGTYELVFIGGSSHNICPETQELRYRIQWFQLDLSVLDVKTADAETGVRSATVQLQLRTSMGPTSGSLFLGRPGQEQDIELTRLPTAWEWRSTDAVDLGVLGASVSLRLDPTLVARQASVAAYPYWNLRASSVANPVVWTWLDLSATGAASAAEVPVGFGPADLVLAAFDLGTSVSTSAVLPSRLHVIARGESAAAATIGTTVRQLQLRHDLPTVTTVDVAAPVDELAGKVLVCEFKPARFDVTLPCGTVALP